MEEKEKKKTFTTTDLIRTDAHEDITWDLIHMVEHDSELKELLQTFNYGVHDVYAIVTTGAPSGTDSPFETCTAVIVPLKPASMEFSIFMASSTATS